MWLKSHKWVDAPGTRAEKRWAMNVRESAHTAVVFDKKYLNVETGRFDTDKLRTLNNLSLVDLITDESCEYYVTPARHRHKSERRIEEERRASVYNFPKHVPKDNEFDEELKRDKEREKLVAHHNQLIEEKEKRKKEIEDKKLAVYW